MTSIIINVVAGLIAVVALYLRMTGKKKLLAVYNVVSNILMKSKQMQELLGEGKSTKEDIEIIKQHLAPKHLKAIAEETLDIHNVRKKVKKELQKLWKSGKVRKVR